MTLRFYRGCITCGFITKNVISFCPDCGDALVLALLPSHFGAEGALEMQKEYCGEMGIVRDWDDELHRRIDAD